MPTDPPCPTAHIPCEPDLAAARLIQFNGLGARRLNHFRTPSEHLTPVSELRPRPLLMSWKSKESLFRMTVAQIRKGRLARPFCGVSWDYHIE